MRDASDPLWLCWIAESQCLLRIQSLHLRSHWYLRSSFHRCCSAIAIATAWPAAAPAPSDQFRSPSSAAMLNRLRTRASG
jgi:hypothetical protein